MKAKIFMGKLKIKLNLTKIITNIFYNKLIEEMGFFQSPKIEIQNDYEPHSPNGLAALNFISMIIIPLKLSYYCCYVDFNKNTNNRLLHTI